MVFAGGRILSKEALGLPVQCKADPHSLEGDTQLERDLRIDSAAVEAARTVEGELHVDSAVDVRILLEGRAHTAEVLHSRLADCGAAHTSDRVGSCTDVDEEPVGTGLEETARRSVAQEGSDSTDLEEEAAQIAVVQEVPVHKIGLEGDLPARTAAGHLSCRQSGLVILCASLQAC